MTRGCFGSSSNRRRNSEISTGEDVVADRGVGPCRVEQPVLRHHLAGALGQTHEDHHHLGFEAMNAAWAGHAVERRLDVIGLADPKAVLHRPCFDEKAGR